MPKKPKAPKKSASLRVWENYERRLKDWKQKVSKIESEKKRKAAIIARAKRMK